MTTVPLRNWFSAVFAAEYQGNQVSVVVAGVGSNRSLYNKDFVKK